MKHDAILQCGIHVSLNAMQKMFITAPEETSEVCNHFDQDEQNMAIGAIPTLYDQVE